MTATENFAPVLLDGEPLVTIVHMMELDAWLYVQEDASSEHCHCRRCRKQDFGGCVVAEAQWGLVLWMADPYTTHDPYSEFLEPAIWL